MRGGERLDRSRQIADVNALVPTLAARTTRGAGEWLFMCECDLLGCDTRILLTLRQYEVMRSAGKPVLAPGHYVTAGELLRRRARSLVDEARALRAQAMHQIRRATRNLDGRYP